MSLRADIHDAYDELTAPSPGLSDRLLATAAVRPQTGRRWTVRVRAPLSLIAAVAAIALVVGALMGGRLLADWHSFQAPHQVAPQTPLQKLEARPLHFAAVPSISACPTGPYNKDGAAGVGPFHIAASYVGQESTWGTYYMGSILYSDGPVAGPVLLRAEDLIRHERLVFVGLNAYGPIVRTDVLNGVVVSQHLEFVLEDVTAPYSWQFDTGWPKNSTPCVGWQVDGPGFSETFGI